MTEAWVAENDAVVRGRVRRRSTTTAFGASRRRARRSSEKALNSVALGEHAGLDWRSRRLADDVDRELHDGDVDDPAASSSPAIANTFSENGQTAKGRTATAAYRKLAASPDAAAAGRVRSNQSNGNSVARPARRGQYGAADEGSQHSLRVHGAGVRVWLRTLARPAAAADGTSARPTATAPAAAMGVDGEVVYVYAHTASTLYQRRSRHARGRDGRRRSAGARSAPIR